MVDIAQAADVSPAVMTAAQKAALQKTIETCSACHGINGRSVAPTFPNLAAQSAPYIEVACFQGSNPGRSGRTGLHVGHGIAARRRIDHQTCGIFFQTISR
jgi:cytochrome c553